jgi:hypothetical protein
LVGDHEDSQPEVSDDAADWPESRSATRPGRKTRVATAKQSSSRAAMTTVAAKTAKLEADKKKWKRKTIPTPTSKEIEEEDEATDYPSVVDDRPALRLLSPTTKRQREMERQVTEEDLRRIREAQVATAGAQPKMLVKI